MIDSKTRLQSLVKAITIGEVALRYTDFERTTVDSSGKTVGSTFKAIEVLRRQPDGERSSSSAIPTAAHDALKRIEKMRRKNEWRRSRRK